MSRTKNLEGQVFGNLKVIGDTGKRDKANRQIVLVRNLETNEIEEVIGSYLVRGSRTGFIGSEENKEHARRLGKSNNWVDVEKLHKANIVDGTTKNFLSRKPDNRSFTGYRNIFYSKSVNRWIVRFQYKGKTKTKHFSDIEEAFDYLSVFEEKELNITPTLKVANEYIIAKQKEIDESIANIKTKEAKRKLALNIRKGKGVSYKKDKKKWKAYIRIDGKQKHLGYFDNEEQALNARKAAELKYFN